MKFSVKGNMVFFSKDERWYFLGIFELFMIFKDLGRMIFCAVVIPKLVRNHFPRSNKFSKIFNLNTIKISYDSMPSVKNLIKLHNSKILNNDQDKIQRPCTCRRKKSCLLNGMVIQMYGIQSRGNHQYQLLEIQRNVRARVQIKIQ